MNLNPRIGVLLRQYRASERLRGLFAPYWLRGLRWVERHCPEVLKDREMQELLAKRKVKSC